MHLDYVIKHAGWQPKQVIAGITRRRFHAALLAAAAGSALPIPAHAEGPDFTIAIIPDPQNLALTCGGGRYYTGLFNWIANNRNLTLRSSAPSFPANIKAVIGVGDCMNNPSSTENASAVSAWSVLDAAGIPWVTPPGNHDYLSNAPANRANLGPLFNSGYFSSSSRALAYGRGIPIGGNDMAFWVGSFDSTGANMAVKFVISGVHMLVLSMDFFAGSDAWNWAYAVHQAHLDCECYITTHGWLRMDGSQFGRTDLYGPGDTLHYSMADSPYSNCTQQVWSGTGAHGLTAPVGTWSNLFGCFGGHDIDPQLGGPSAWYWQRTPITSNSVHRQTVQQFFMNSQERDAACMGVVNRSTGDGETAHVFLLSRRLSLGRLEGRMISTQTGDWIGTRASGWSPAETLLFSVPFYGLSNVSRRRRVPRR